MAKKQDEATTKFKVDISDLTKNITAAKKQIALASAEFKNSTAGLDDWSKSADGVSSKLTQLGKNLQSQKSILADYRKQYELTKNQYGENSKAAVDLKIKIENQEAAIKTTEKGIEKYNGILADLTEESNKTVSAADNLSETIKSQEKELAGLKKEYASAVISQGENSSAAQNLAKQIESLSTEISENKNTLKSASDAADIFDKSLNDVSDESKKAVSAVDDLSETIKTQEKDLGELKNKYASVVLTQGKNSDAAKDLAKQIDDLSSDLSDNKKALKSVNEAADKLDNSFDDLEDSTKDAGEAAENSADGFSVMKGALANLVAEGIKKAVDGVKQLATDALETGRNFESSMSEVQAISGSTGDDLQLLSDTAKKFGASTVFSASESADALKYMALAGWNAKQSTDALGGVLNLAAASGMDLANASDMVTDYLSAFGMQAKDSAYFADLLAYSQSNSNTSAEQLGEAYKNCAANLNAAGQDIETTTSLLAMMANQGLKGSEGGTALTAVMRDMTSKMKDGAIAIGDTNVQVMDASGNYRDLTDILKDVESATDGMGDAQKAAALSSTFTSDSIKGLNLILNAGVSNAADFESQLRKCGGSAEDMANVMNDNLEGDLKALNSAYEDLGITIYESATGSMREFVQEVTEDLMPAIKGVVTGVDGADEALGNAIGGLLSKIIDQITKSLPQVGAVGISLITSLIQGILSALPQLVTSVVQMTGEIIQGLASAWPDIASAVTDALPLIIESIAAMLPDLISAAIGLVQSIVDSIPDIIQALIAAILTIVQALIDGLVSSYQTLTDGALQLLMALVDVIPNDVIPALISALPDILNTILQGLLGAIPQLLDACVQFWMAIVEALPEITVAIIDALPEIITTIIDVLLDNIPLLLDCAVKLFMTLVQAIPKIISELRKAVPKIIESIMTTLAKLGPKLSTLGSDILAKVVSWFGDMISKAAEYGLIFVENLSDKVKNIPGKLEEIFHKGIDKVKEFGNNLKEKAKEAGKKLIDNVIDAVKGLPDNIKSIGADVITGFWTGMTNKFDWLTGQIKGFANDVTDKLKSFFGIHSPSRVMRDQVGKYISLGIAEGIKANKKSVTSAVTDLGENVLATLKIYMSEADFKDHGATLVKKLCDGVKDNISNFSSSINAYVKKYKTALNDAAKTRDKSIKEAAKTQTKALKDAATTRSKALKSATESYKDSAKKIKDEYKTLIDDVVKKRESMKDKLSGIGDLFEKGKDDSDTIVLSDLTKQTKQIKSLGHNMNALKDQISDELMNQIVDMNTDDAEKFVKALLKLSPKELKAYDKAYTEKLKASSQIAKAWYKDDIEALKRNRESELLQLQDKQSATVAKINAQYEKDIASANAKYKKHLASANKKYRDSVESLKLEYTSKVTKLFNNLITTVSKAGKNAVDGFMSAFKDNVAVNKSLSDFCDSVLNTIKGKFKIHSPSQVMRDQVGKNLILGMVAGVDKYKEQLKKSINSIVADATNLDAIDISAAKRHVPHPNGYGNNNGGGSVTNNTTYTFTQNNTSPKPLNRLELYRQTKNLIKLKPEVG